MPKRRKASSTPAAPLINHATGLPEPFPASPHRPTKYAVYVAFPASAPPAERRRIVLTFAAAYSARHFIDAALGHRPFKWLKANTAFGYTIPDTIVGENDVEIRCPITLEELMEHEFTPAEKAWELPEWIERQCLLIRRLPGDDIDEDEKPAKAARDPKPEKEKLDKTGLTSIGDIAEACGVLPRIARAALRAAGLEKPAGGWLFSAADVDKITKIVKGAK